MAVRRTWLVLLSSILLVAGIAGGVGLLIWIGGRMLLPSPGELYPRAPAMPPGVPDTVEDLLGRFERHPSGSCARSSRLNATRAY